MTSRKKFALRVIVPLIIFTLAFVGLPTWTAYARCVYFTFNTEGSFFEKLGTALAQAFSTQTASACGRGGWEPFGKPKPVDPCDPVAPLEQCDHYDIWNPEGPDVRWPAATAAAGIHYSLHIYTTPEFNASIESSFSPWPTSGGKIKFIRDADQNISINSLTVSDDINSVRFGDLSNVTEGWYVDPNGHRGYLSIQRDNVTGAATGATRAWHNAVTGLIYEADTVLNINLSWSTKDPPGFGTYYVPNTMVHEAGHWLDLADLYGDGERELTMYYQTPAEETKYATLGVGDAMGVKALYP